MVELVEEVELLQEMMAWHNLYEGDVIFVDRNAFDSRKDVNLGIIGEMSHPWVIIRKVEDNTSDLSEGGDRLLVAPLTSNINNPRNRNNDGIVLVTDLKKNKLLKPSAIKVYQSTTISPYVVNRVVGYVSDDILDKLQHTVNRLNIKY